MNAYLRMRHLAMLVSVFLSLTATAQESNFINSVSPKLRLFLDAHPQCLSALTNVISHVFSHRTAQLYYFYSNDESKPRAYHYYPSRSAVCIVVRENQRPLDEYISLIFETLNSKGESSFQSLAHRAHSGAIPKSDFVQAVLKIEFSAVKKTRNLLRTLKLSSKDVSGSHYFKRFEECPDQFEAFLNYSERVSSPHRNPVKELEAQYERLRNQ